MNIHLFTKMRNPMINTAYGISNNLENHPMKGTYMNEITPDIHVFKTNIGFAHDVKKISPVLGEESRIKKWSVDVEDVDNVLRVEAHRIEPTEIISLITQCGYSCEELTD